MLGSYIIYFLCSWQEFSTIHNAAKKLIQRVRWRFYKASCHHKKKLKIQNRVHGGIKVARSADSAAFLSAASFSGHNSSISYTVAF